MRAQGSLGRGLAEGHLLHGEVVAGLHVLPVRHHVARLPVHPHLHLARVAHLAPARRAAVAVDDVLAAEVRPAPVRPRHAHLLRPARVLAAGLEGGGGVVHDLGGALLAGRGGRGVLVLLGRAHDVVGHADRALLGEGVHLALGHHRGCNKIKTLIIIIILVTILSPCWGFIWK